VLGWVFEGVCIGAFGIAFFDRRKDCVVMLMLGDVMCDV
jgi:hypothetical protein